jgi:outer membrane murein-binding lipoprotein Lpp
MARISKEKRDRLILVIVGSLIIAAGVWYGVIKTRKTQLQQSVSKLAAAKDKLERAKNRVKQAEYMETAAEEATRRLRAFEEGMAPGTDLYSWSYVLLDNAGAGQKVEIIEQTRPQTNEVGVLAAFPYTATTFTVRGNAHYHDFGKFLADFENKFPYFRAQNLLLGTASEAGLEAATTRLGKDALYFKMDIVALIKPSK